MLTAEMIAQSIYDTEMNGLERCFQIETAQDLINLDVNNFRNAVLNGMEEIFGINYEDIHTAMINILINNFRFEQQFCNETGDLSLVAA